jgi:hypothetical protein
MSPAQRPGVQLRRCQDRQEPTTRRDRVRGTRPRTRAPTCPHGSRQLQRRVGQPRHESDSRHSRSLALVVQGVELSASDERPDNRAHEEKSRSAANRERSQVVVRSVQEVDDCNHGADREWNDDYVPKDRNAARFASCQPCSESEVGCASNKARVPSCQDQQGQDYVTHLRFHVRTPRGWL